MAPSNKKLLDRILFCTSHILSIHILFMLLFCTSTLSKKTNNAHIAAPQTSQASNTQSNNQSNAQKAKKQKAKQKQNMQALLDIAKKLDHAKQKQIQRTSKTNHTHTHAKNDEDDKYMKEVEKIADEIDKIGKTPKKGYTIKRIFARLYRFLTHIYKNNTNKNTSQNKTDIDTGK